MTGHLQDTGPSAWTTTANWTRLDVCEPGKKGMKV
jgi:hypothetical protein